MKNLAVLISLVFAVVCSNVNAQEAAIDCNIDSLIKVDMYPAMRSEALSWYGNRKLSEKEVYDHFAVEIKYCDAKEGRTLKEEKEAFAKQSRTFMHYDVDDVYMVFETIVRPYYSQPRTAFHIRYIGKDKKLHFIDIKDIWGMGNCSFKTLNKDKYEVIIQMHYITIKKNKKCIFKGCPMGHENGSNFRPFKGMQFSLWKQ